MSSIFPAPLSFLFYHLSLTLSPLLLSTSPLSLIFFPSFFSTTIYNILFSPSIFFSLLSLVPPILPPPYSPTMSFIPSSLLLSTLFFFSLSPCFFPSTSYIPYLLSTIYPILLLLLRYRLPPPCPPSLSLLVYLSFTTCSPSLALPLFSLPSPSSSQPRHPCLRLLHSPLST